MAESVCVVLTGGPGSGKSTIGRLVAQRRSRGALVEVDDVRHMLVQPHVAPWGGAEGHRQQRLGVQNACDLVRNFLADGCDVIVADVLTDETADLYRSSISGVAVVQLGVTVQTAIDRAQLRDYALTDEEIRRLHAQQAALTEVDLQLDTENLGIKGVVDRIERRFPL